MVLPASTESWGVGRAVVLPASTTNLGGEGGLWMVHLAITTPQFQDQQLKFVALIFLRSQKYDFRMPLTLHLTNHPILLKAQQKDQSCNTAITCMVSPPPPPKEAS